MFCRSVGMGRRIGTKKAQAALLPVRLGMWGVRRAAAAGRLGTGTGGGSGCLAPMRRGGRGGGFFSRQSYVMKGMGIGMIGNRICRIKVSAVLLDCQLFT